MIRFLNRLFRRGPACSMCFRSLPADRIEAGTCSGDCEEWATDAAGAY